MLPEGLPQGPVGLLLCEVTRRDGLSDKDPTGLGRVVVGTEQKEITTSPWAPASAAGAIFFLEPRQLGPFWLKHSATNCVYGYEQGGNRSRHQQTAA
jgi:hypothetical protein